MIWIQIKIQILIKFPLKLFRICSYFFFLINSNTKRFFFVLSVLYLLFYSDVRFVDDVLFTLKKLFILLFFFLIRWSKNIDWRFKRRVFSEKKENIILVQTSKITLRLLKNAIILRIKVKCWFYSIQHVQHFSFNKTAFNSDEFAHMNIGDIDNTQYLDRAEFGNEVLVFVEVLDQIISEEFKTKKVLMPTCLLVY